MYWVIKGLVRVRQRIVAVKPAAGTDGVKRCALHLDRALTPVLSRPMRAFQGWRYLEEESAPPDLAAMAKGADRLPPKMAEDLRALGLL